MISVYPLGRRSHRQPLAYEPIRTLCHPDIQVVTLPENADILVAAHTDDLHENLPMLARLVRRDPDMRVVLLSEEPLWDTVWNSTPFARCQQLEAEADVRIPVTCLNHHTSPIFNFDLIPYFILTSHAFFARYSLRFKKNSQLTTAQWRHRFESAQWQAAFVAERRVADKFRVAYPDHEVWGLSSFRSDLARNYQTRSVQRIGRGWQKGVRRQNLPDWHLDKLLTLDRRCRIVSGLENTHQWNYVTEKPFDALAVGAVPIYYAAAVHGIRKIIPDGVWINLFGRSVNESCHVIDDLEIDSNFLANYSDCQQWLADLFTTTAYWTEERDRLRTSIIAELSAVASGG